jgi:lipopolysaccharide export system permease protein
MPVGLLLGVVLAFGRLYHDSEMAAALACGVGPSRIYWPVGILAALVTVVIGWLSLFVSPAMFARTLELRTAAFQAGRFAPVAAGKFRSFGGADFVVYAEGSSPDGALENVFVQRAQDARVEVALAARATREMSADGMSQIITLYDGERFEGVPGSTQFRIMRFERHVIPVEVPQIRAVFNRPDILPTADLLASNDPARRAELHWRIALPVMCVVLTLLAVPLSRLRPRQGRYARVWLAVLLYFVYSNLVSAGRTWISRGTLPEAIGLWWVHAAVVLLVLGVLAGPGALARLRYRRLA